MANAFDQFDAANAFDQFDQNEQEDRKAGAIEYVGEAGHGNTFYSVKGFFFAVRSNSNKVIALAYYTIRKISNIDINWVRSLIEITYQKDIVHSK